MVAVATVGPLGLALPQSARAAGEAGEPPTVMKKVTDGVHIFDQAYGIPGLEVGRKLRTHGNHLGVFRIFCSWTYMPEYVL